MQKNFCFFHDEMLSTDSQWLLQNDISVRRPLMFGLKVGNHFYFFQQCHDWSQYLPDIPDIYTYVYYLQYIYINKTRSGKHAQFACHNDIEVDSRAFLTASNLVKKCNNATKWKQNINFWLCNQYVTTDYPEYGFKKIYI